MTSSSSMSRHVVAVRCGAPRARPAARDRGVQTASGSARHGDNFGAAGALATTLVSTLASGDAESVHQHDEPARTEQRPSIAFWTIREVEFAVKLKKSAIYARISRGTFPPPVKLSSTVSVWIESEVRTWMHDAALSRCRPELADFRRWRAESALMIRGTR